MGGHVARIVAVTSAYSILVWKTWRERPHVRFRRRSRIILKRLLRNLWVGVDWIHLA
jgi:hypothetical protein